MILYSVVIPMYNSEKTIIDAVRSVFNQTRVELIDEVIVVDDGSTDYSILVLEKYKYDNDLKKIKIIKTKNGGAASARNVGIREAKNNMIALLDADDIWLENKIEIQNEIFIKNENIKALGSNRTGEKVYVGSKFKQNIRKISPFQYCIKNWPCTPSLIFDKTIFSTNEYFDEKMTHAEEGMFFIDLAYLSGLYYVEDILVDCGHGKRSFGESGLSGNIKKMHSGVLTMLNKAKEKGYISIISYIFLKQYERLKYIRRKLIVVINNKKR